MTRRTRSILGAFAALLLWAASAHATVAPPSVKIRWHGDPPQAAKAGQSFEGRFEVIAGGPGQLEVAIEGAGWSLDPLAGATSGFLAKGDRRTFTFRGVPADEKAPLIVRCTFNGQTTVKEMRLDATSLEHTKQRRAVAREAPKVEGGGQRSAGSPILVRGRITYVRGDTAPMPVIGADNIVVKVWDDDSPDPFDEVMFEGTTDTQGNFAFAFNWDDGPDDPDIYVEFITASGHMEVQANDFLETTYAWDNEHQVVEDFTGTVVDFGDLSPAPGDNGAVHVWNSVVRARRYATVHGGMAAQPYLDVQWPRDDPNTTSRYSSEWREIYITTGHTWSEYTHIHEYAHYLEDMFSILYPSEYSNPGGYCDIGTAGHCLWCRENNLVAWQEGWAEWFGMSLASKFEDLYGEPAWTMPNDARQLETHGACCGLNPPGQPCSPNQLQPGFETEGYVAALLWDMEDAANEPGNAATPCDADAMSVGPGPILQTIRQSIFDLLDFIQEFQSQYPQHVQDFWSTARFQAVPFGFAAPPPIVTSQPASCTVARVGENFQIAVQGNGSKLKYQWRRNGVELFDGPGLTGSEEAVLQFWSVGAHMSGTYSCRVSTCSESLSVISLPARITILPTADANPLMAWGDNRYGQAADGTTVGFPPPGIRPLNGAIAVDGGGGVSAALKSDGTVWTWGTPGFHAELGNGWSSATVTVPTQVAGFDSALALSMGHNHTLTLRRDGTIWGWGYNGFGVLGEGTQNSVPVPTHADEVEGCVKAVTTGSQHSLALMADGTVLAWGSNASGALGRGTSGGWSVDPQPVQGLTDVVAISAGRDANLALKADGTVWAWGWNFSGGLGAGLPDVSGNGFSAVPVQVVGLTNVRAICMSYANGYAVKNDGTCWSWGTGQTGQLGDGTWPFVTHRNVPGLMPDLVNPVALDAADGGFRFAVMPDGTMKMWGYNDSHAFGGPTPNVVNIPTTIPGLIGVSAVGTAFATSYALGHVSVADVATNDVPIRLALRVSPNPSFARSTLAFDLPRAGRVSLAIYDLAGRRVTTVLDEARDAGRHQATWDGRAGEGRAAVAGVYFARLDLGGEVITERIVRMP